MNDMLILGCELSFPTCHLFFFWFNNLRVCQFGENEIRQGPPHTVMSKCLSH